MLLIHLPLGEISALLTLEATSHITIAVIWVVEGPFNASPIIISKDHKNEICMNILFYFLLTNTNFTYLTANVHARLFLLFVLQGVFIL